jgi:hypothetical protein
MVLFHAWVLATLLTSCATAVVVNVNAGTVVQSLNRSTLLGCHTDPGFMHQPQGFLSQMIVGEAFETMRALKSGWSNWTDGSNAVGTAVLDYNTLFGAAARPSMRIDYGPLSPGDVGIAHRGMGNEVSLNRRAND